MQIELAKAKTIESLVNLFEGLQTDFIVLSQLIGHYKNSCKGLDRPLATYYDDVVNSYITAFEKKEDVEIERFGKDDSSFFVADMTISFNDLKFSIDENFPKELIFDYLDFSETLYFEEISPANIQNWYKYRWTAMEYIEMKKVK